MASTIDIPIRVWQAAIAAAAVVLGVLAGLDPRYAVLAIGGGALFALVLSDMAVGLCVFTVITFIETVPNPLGTLSVAKLVGLLLAGAWLAKTAVGERQRGFAGRHPFVTAICLALLVWMGLSAIWAEQFSAWLNSAQSWVLDIALFPIVFVALREPRHVAWLFAAFVAGTVASAMYGLATGTGNVGVRLGGAALGPNLLGGLAAASAILAVTLGLRLGQRLRARVLAFFGAGACVVVVVLSASREAALALAVALVVAPILAGGRHRGRTIFRSVLVALTAVILFLAFAPASTQHRLFASDPTGSGRTDIWQVGLRMVKANPIEGVGAGNFPVSSVHYLFQPGVLLFSKYIVDQPKVAHNIYLEVLAELGVVGFVLFLTLLAFCVRCAWLAAQEFAKQNDRSAEILARGLLLALVGLLAADFFSSELFAKQLWLLLAMAPAMLAIAERRSTKAGSASPR